MGHSLPEIVKNRRGLFRFGRQRGLALRGGHDARASRHRMTGNNRAILRAAELAEAGLDTKLDD